MKILVRKRFINDVSKIRSVELIDEVLYLLDLSHAAIKAEDIPGFKMMRGYKVFARIKLNDFRIGIHVEKEVLIFVCILPRSEIYKQFP